MTRRPFLWRIRAGELIIVGDILLSMVKVVTPACITGVGFEAFTNFSICMSVFIAPII